MTPRSSPHPNSPESLPTPPDKDSLTSTKKEETSFDVSSSKSLTDSERPSNPRPEMGPFLEAIDKLADVRQQRITKIQKSIQLGIYSVSSETLADKIIQELQTPPQEASPSTPPKTLPE